MTVERSLFSSCLHINLSYTLSIRNDKCSIRNKHGIHGSAVVGISRKFLDSSSDPNTVQPVSSTCYKQESLFDAIAIISSLSRQMLSAVTFLSMFTAVDTFPESLSAKAENGKTNQYFLFFCYVRLQKKRNLLTQSHLVKTCKLVVLVDDIGHRGHYGRIDETEDENDAWPKVTENQTNHVVVTESTVLSRSRNICYVIAVVENNKDIMKMVHEE